jgi:hypothetical protein
VPVTVTMAPPVVNPAEGDSFATVGSVVVADAESWVTTVDTPTSAVTMTARSTLDLNMSPPSRGP